MRTLKYLAIRLLLYIVKFTKQSITYKDVVTLLTVIITSKGNNITNEDVYHLLDGMKQ